MSTLEYINDNYDKSILVFIFGATLAVMVLIAILVLTVDLPMSWVLLPASWWVGGMMVWAQGRYMRTKANR